MREPRTSHERTMCACAYALVTGLCYACLVWDAESACCKEDQEERGQSIAQREGGVGRRCSLCVYLAAAGLLPFILRPLLTHSTLMLAHGDAEMVTGARDGGAGGGGAHCMLVMGTLVRC